MYEGDTFWQLSLIGQIGLVAISGMMAAGTLWVTWRLARRAPWLSRLLIGLGALVLFEWLAPQVHYLWYLAVIEGLPLHWVIGPWPQPLAAWHVLSFQAPDSLSAHARGALGWACVGLAVAAPWLGRRRPDRMRTWL